MRLPDCLIKQLLAVTMANMMGTTQNCWHILQAALPIAVHCLRKACRHAAAADTDATQWQDCVA